MFIPLESSENLLAIHAIGHATMAWNAVTKVLDIEGTFEARCEESPKRCNKRSEYGEN